LSDLNPELEQFAVNAWRAPKCAFVIVRLDRRDLVWINVTATPTAEWVACQITEAFPWNEAMAWRLGKVLYWLSCIGAVFVAGTGVAIYVAAGAKNDGLILMGVLLVLAAFLGQSERLSSIFFPRVDAAIIEKPQPPFL